MAVNVKGLAHIALYVADIEKSVGFYADVLGFSRTYYEDRDVMKYAEIRAGSCIIEILEWKDSSRLDGRPEARGTVDHFAVEVDDVDAAAREIERAGVASDVKPFTIPDLLGGVRCFFIKGPDEESIEIFELSKKE